MESSTPNSMQQNPSIDMNHLKMMESSGDPMSFNKHSKARGLYQITPIVLDEWNNFNKKARYSREDLFNPDVNTKIADWYMHKRIPQMLTHFKKPLTVDNMLISYNAGINYVVDGSNLPDETKEYLKRYHSRTGGGSNGIDTTMS